MDEAEKLDLEDVMAASRFRGVLRALSAAGEKKVRAHGITPQQYQLMLVIKGAPDGSEALTVGNVAAALQVAQSTATELIRRAEERGLLQRRSSNSDRRHSIVCLTVVGESIFTRCFRDLGQERGEMLDAMEGFIKALRP